MGQNNGPSLPYTRPTNALDLMWWPAYGRVCTMPAPGAYSVRYRFGVMR